MLQRRCLTVKKKDTDLHPFVYLGPDCPTLYYPRNVKVGAGISPNLKLQIVILKHNTYSRIESFDGITSIGENLSKTEKYKGTILIKVFIWVTVLLRIFFQVNSITQNFCFEIFFGKANNVIYLQTNCHKKNCKWLLKIFQLWKLFRLALFVRVFQL